MVAFALAIAAIAALCACAVSPTSTIADLRARVEARREAEWNDYVVCVSKQDYKTRMRQLSLAVASPQDDWAFRYLRAYSAAGFSFRFTPILTRTGRVDLTLTYGCSAAQCRMFLNDTISLLTEADELAGESLEAHDLDIVEIPALDVDVLEGCKGGNYYFCAHGTLSENVSRG